MNIPTMKHFGLYSLLKWWKRCFDSFGELILKEIKRCIGNRNIIENIFSMQTFGSVMCGNRDFTALFFPNNFKEDHRKYPQIFNLHDIAKK